MAPMLVPRHDVGRIVLVVEMVRAIGIQKHAIGIIHEILRRAEMDLRPKRASVVAWDGGASGDTGFGVCSRARSGCLGKQALREGEQDRDGEVGGTHFGGEKEDGRSLHMQQR